MRYALIAPLALAAGCGNRATPTAPAARAVAAFETAQPQADSVATDMVIRTGQARIEVDSVDRAVDRVRDLARDAGGYIGSSSIWRGEDNVRSAALAVSVPEARFDRVLGELAPLGRVESVNVTARDVGEEYVDVQARVANARRLEERLVTLLATRTGKLKDVLDVERELARVRGDIEHYEGHIRYLKAHSAMSTLEVTVHEHEAVLAESPGEHPIREAVHQAWRNFVGLVAMAIASLGILLPVVAIGAGAWFLYRRRHSPPCEPPASGVLDCGP